MNATHDYVLVLDQRPSGFQSVEMLLRVLKYPTVVASLTDQVVERINEDFPYLIILVGNHQDWPKALLSELRHIADYSGGTILSLADNHMPSWIRQEENPGFDGFLVQPLSPDVLVSLIQSAWIKQVCSFKSCPLPQASLSSCPTSNYVKTAVC